MKTVYGVGYSSDKSLCGEYRSIYKKWAEMLRRCYKDTNPAYSECEVSEEWKDFTVFLPWYLTNCKDSSYQLDKDILVQGNKIYGPDTCCFVPKEINSILINCGNKDRVLPLGVSVTPSGRYEVRVSYKGKTKFFKSFESIKSAELFYKEKKKEILELYLENYKDELSLNVVNALRLFRF